MVFENCCKSHHSGAINATVPNRDFDCEGLFIIALLEMLAKNLQPTGLNPQNADLCSEFDKFKMVLETFPQFLQNLQQLEEPIGSF